MKRLMTLLAALGFAAFAGASFAGGASGETIGVTCAGCHGTDGMSKGAAPGLHGLDAKTIEQAMIAFKTDQRPATIMNRIAKGYTDAEIKAMAKYFASLK